MLPLTQLTKKNQAFVWTPEADKAFTQLKEAFTSAPVLAHVDPEKPFIIEADASDFALGSILSQPGEDGHLHPVAFHSRKFNVAEINYEVRDKELLWSTLWRNDDISWKVRLIKSSFIVTTKILHIFRRLEC